MAHFNGVVVSAAYVGQRLMVSLFNETGTIGIIINAITVNVTGNLFFTMLVIIMFLFVILTAARVPFQMQPILLLPFFLTLMAFTGEFLAIGGAILILLGIWAAYAVAGR